PHAYTPSLHAALPIYLGEIRIPGGLVLDEGARLRHGAIAAHEQRLHLRRGPLLLPLALLLLEPRRLLSVDADPPAVGAQPIDLRSEEHTSELQSRFDL